MIFFANSELAIRSFGVTNFTKNYNPSGGIWGKCRWWPLPRPPGKSIIRW